MTEEEKKKQEPETVEKQTEVPTIVLSELPKIESRNGIDGEGKPLQIITIEEAITEILEKVRRIDKAL